MDHNRSESKIQRMVRKAIEIAEDPTFGYSQKPPSGRWGPDFDCSSLMYYIANYAGYSVGIGGDKVRFTGTMLEDFKDAGFQILPFANVGISDLKIGDILLNLALHAEVYVGDGQTIGALSSETGGFVGESGDQNGEEITKHPAIIFNKGWDYVLRPPEEETDTSEDTVEDNEEKEGDDMPYYGNNLTAWPTNGTTYGRNNYNTPMGPQGNLGQMNGYSQAGTYNPMNPMNTMGQNGMYGQPNYSMPSGPQGMGGQQLIFVKGIEGAKNQQQSPNSTVAYFDEDESLMYVKSTDQQGMPQSIRVFRFEECSEDMPQHLSPLMSSNMNTQMPQEGFVTREEFNQLKEMLGNAESTVQSGPQGNGSNSRNQQSGGQQGNRSNGRNS